MKGRITPPNVYYGNQKLQLKDSPEERVSVRRYKEGQETQRFSSDTSVDNGKINGTPR